MVASDKLFFWLFQNQPDRILQLQSDLPPDAGGYRFSAPVLKEREYRLDGLFLPPPERPDLPALILEAQMAADAGRCGWWPAPIVASKTPGHSTPALDATKPLW